MSKHLDFWKTVERPDKRMWIRDSAGTLIDFSGYTFSFKLGAIGAAASFTKTSGITGAAGSGVEPTGTPNVTLSFSANELDSLVPGEYAWQLRTTTGSLDRGMYEGTATVHDIIT